MATLQHIPRGFACSSGKKLTIFEYSDEAGVTKKEIELELPAENSSTDNKQEDEDAIEKKAPSKNEEHVLATSVSPSGRYLAVCDTVKQLHLFDAETEWTRHSTRELPRRCTSVTFTQDDLQVLVADKTGDVYRYNVKEGYTEGNSGEDDKGAQLMLGHLSMLLDVVLTNDDKYIVTCDRDEKIRVSHYPNCYNIHTFCMGHKGYVSSLVYVERNSLLISGGGEGEIIVWTLSGERLAGAVCVDESQRSSQDHGDFGVKKLSYDPDTGVLAAVCYGSNIVYVFRLENSELGTSLKQSVSMTTDVEPWDICFDCDHHFWVLQPKEGDCARVYQWNNEAFMMRILTTEEKRCRASLLLEAINSSWEFFEESVGMYTHLPEGLRKVKIDNMKDYLEKKQERVSGTKRKIDQSESTETAEITQKDS
ncbi:tRNA (guanine-N(7)-)-methyltransferase non-catalytic subunit wdr4-like [Mizuhopecten yessoensis]|uniref:tRNA (guanine-N(7)-)-methyltransferase non-catalytic subunit wdr4-like n=1 Tax=Mizuhopecten yessoensis TaxID=6573 RepID=UPI000B459A23|nr:tRNA (guanine-N(7)-)-methyltransferase non-catalytic subunit wdr4-like [Mizuhopecten yessoensis]